MLCACVLRNSYTNIEKYDACGGNSFQRKHRRLKSTYQYISCFVIHSVFYPCIEQSSY